MNIFINIFQMECSAFAVILYYEGGAAAYPPLLLSVR